MLVLDEADRMLDMGFMPALRRVLPPLPRMRQTLLFRQRCIRVLVATDIAARGLDVAQLPLVVNYDLPLVAEDYVHRVGRTGRAAVPGHAVSLVTADEKPPPHEISEAATGSASARRRRRLRGEQRASAFDGAARESRAEQAPRVHT